jgi:hypothetical protein
MSIFTLWAVMALCPAAAVNVGCGHCDCCGCCESANCSCQDCTCCCR